MTRLKHIPLLAAAGAWLLAPAAWCAAPVGISPNPAVFEVYRIPASFRPSGAAPDTTPTSANRMARKEILSDAGRPSSSTRTLWDGQRYWRLEPVPDLAMIRLASIASSGADGAENPSRAIQALRAQMDIAQPNPRTSIAMARRNPAAASSNNTLNAPETFPAALAASPAVEFSGPVFRCGDRIMGVGDTIVVKFANGVNSAKQDEILDSVGARRMEQPSFPANQCLVQIPVKQGHMTLDAAESLASLPDVEFASVDWYSNYQTYSMPAINDPIFIKQWNLSGKYDQPSVNRDLLTQSSVNAPQAWELTGTAEGITVGIIDDGIQMSHADLNVVEGWDALDNTAGCDPHNSAPHGTAVAGVLAARCGNGYGVCGVAPGAKIVGVRLIESIPILDSQIASAFNYCVDHGAAVINCSWGLSRAFDFCKSTDDAFSSFLSAPIAAAFDNALAKGRGGKGTLIFFAAGNARGSVDGDNQNANKDVICVAASNNAARRSAYSNYGEKISVCAPSSDVTRNTCGRYDGAQCLSVIACFDSIWQGGTLEISTTDILGAAGYSSLDTTGDFGGTSAASPTAAGVMALLLLANPSLDWRTARGILEGSASMLDRGAGLYSASGHSPYYGYGKVDALTALVAARGETHSQDFNIVTSGTETVRILRIYTAGSAPWLILPDVPGEGFAVSAAQPYTLPVSAKASNLTAGAYFTTLVIEYASPSTSSAATGTLSVPISFKVRERPGMTGRDGMMLR